MQIHIAPPGRVRCGRADPAPLPRRRERSRRSGRPWSGWPGSDRGVASARSTSTTIRTGW